VLLQLFKRRDVPMSGPIYFHIRLTFPTPESIPLWKERVLLAQREYLEPVPGFAGIDMGDDDLLGAEITVLQENTLNDALRYLENVGFPFDRTRIVEWQNTVRDGEPAIQFVLAGPLPRSATVGDLLTHLQQSGIESGFIEVLTADATAMVIQGFLPDYDAYREYRLPMIYAGVAASQLGAEGTVSFLGPGEDTEYVATLADFQDGAIAISEPDPQDLVEETLVERFGGIDFEAVYRAWKAQ
jgi:hypothetical protein